MIRRADMFGTLFFVVKLITVDQKNVDNK